MSMYLAGTLFGRLVVAYAIVWIVCWLVLSRLQWREAFRRAHRWYGLTAIVIVFLVGVLVGASRGTIA